MQKIFRTRIAAEKAIHRVQDAVKEIRARNGDIPMCDGGEGFEIETLTIFNERTVVVIVDDNHRDEIHAALKR